MERTTLAGSRYLELPYRIILTKERRKGADAWLALVEELPGCEARGDTPEEATTLLREEMAIWISQALDQGSPIPRPYSTPGSADGRLSLEIPESLHQALALAAIREGLTVDQLVTISLAATIRWKPGAGEQGARWIQARADGVAGGDRSSRLRMNRALMLNAALLFLVALAALIILIVALSHGF